MKLNRKQIRSLIMEELAITSRKNKKSEVNEGFLAGLGIAALATLAIAGYTGLQYLVLEVAIDSMVERDPRVKAKLAELDNLVKENPDMLPADIARMAAQRDAELAAIIDEIEAGAYGRAAVSQGNF